MVEEWHAHGCCMKRDMGLVLCQLATGHDMPIAATGYLIIVHAQAGEPAAAPVSQLTQ